MTMQLRAKSKAARAVAMLALTGFLAACAARTEPAAPTAENCVEIGLSSNGWHAGLYLPASAFSPGGPVRIAFPEADWFAVGWGDARAYPGPLGPVNAVSAVLWPTRSAVHVAAPGRDPRTAYRQDHVDLALSNAQLDTLAAAIEAEFVRGPDGGPVRLGEGLDSRGSAFFAGRSRYHAFRTCNVFIARTLEGAGVETGRTWGHLLPGSLLRAAARRNPQTCPG
ncbi:MAG: DUF2459 domain-containing protein [Oceanicaulis sp.]